MQDFVTCMSVLCLCLRSVFSVEPGSLQTCSTPTRRLLLAHRTDSRHCVATRRKLQLGFFSLKDGLINIAEFTQMVQFVTVAGWLESQAPDSRRCADSTPPDSTTSHSRTVPGRERHDPKGGSAFHLLALACFYWSASQAELADRSFQAGQGCHVSRCWILPERT